MAWTWKHIFRHEHFRAKYWYLGVYFWTPFSTTFRWRIFLKPTGIDQSVPKSPFPSKTQNRETAWTSPWLKDTGAETLRKIVSQPCQAGFDLVLCDPAWSADVAPLKSCALWGHEDHLLVYWKRGVVFLSLWCYFSSVWLYNCSNHHWK